MDDVRIYRHVLSEKEIVELAVKFPGVPDSGEETGGGEEGVNNGIEFQMITSGGDHDGDSMDLQVGSRLRFVLDL